MYKKILMAFNGSREGRSALLESAEIAAFIKAETHLLAVAGMFFLTRRDATFNGLWYFLIAYFLWTAASTRRSAIFPASTDPTRAPSRAAWDNVLLR